ncbi:MAG: site-2 protease family protein [Acidobacteria bacterium]|nr:site-2 protease family protein [Acidobacteriota bacterium]
MSLTHVGIVFQVIVFLFAISVHESAHAWTAWRRGDPTAYMLGRVTLNPIRHIDPFGTFLLPLFCLISNLPVIGWAKPVPVNPRNFKNEVRDDILTSVAGPVSNFLVAAGAVLAMGLIAVLSPEEGRIVVRSVAAGFLVETQSVLLPITLLLYNAMLINVLLGVFNLIPIPPLDGSHVLRHMLSESARRLYDTFGMVGLLLLFLVGGRVVSLLMRPVVGFFDAILMRL